MPAGRRGAGRRFIRPHHHGGVRRDVRAHRGHPHDRGVRAAQRARRPAPRMCRWRDGQVTTRPSPQPNLHHASQSLATPYAITACGASGPLGLSTFRFADRNEETQLEVLMALVVRAPPSMLLDSSAARWLAGTAYHCYSGGRPDGGPHNGGCDTCTGVVTVHDHDVGDQQPRRRGSSRRRRRHRVEHGRAPASRGLAAGRSRLVQSHPAGRARRRTGDVRLGVDRGGLAEEHPTRQPAAPLSTD